jgi:AcrR family transcriptional regulator
MAAARVVKEHDERRNEILDAAQLLFHQQGYDATSVNTIIGKLNVSKGTFYHYFASKEDLLDSLVDRFTVDIMRLIHEATRKEGLSALERLDAYFRVAGQHKAANAEMIFMMLKALYRDENILLRHKTDFQIVRKSASEIADIIRQGVAEGVFDVGDPDDTAELILNIAMGIRESMAQLWLQLPETPDLWDEIQRKTKGFETAIERILGAPAGSIRLVDPEVLEMFRKSVSESE